MICDERKVDRLRDDLLVSDHPAAILLSGIRDRLIVAVAVDECAFDIVGTIPASKGKLAIDRAHYQIFSDREVSGISGRPVDARIDVPLAIDKVHGASHRVKHLLDVGGVRIVGVDDPVEAVAFDLPRILCGDEFVARFDGSVNVPAWVSVKLVIGDAQPKLWVMHIVQQA